MSHEQKKFSFELNESLYFEKGQEVAEMMQISLDPEITIQPFNDYVSIRGVIELQGEYQKTLGNGEDAGKTSNFDMHHSYRYVENVTDTLEGGATFSHQFPVEISIPSYRVQDFNEITVSIESFDYEIPDENQLKLNASIDINGISMETGNELGRHNVTEDEEEIVSVSETEVAPKSQDEVLNMQVEQETFASNVEQEGVRTEETEQQEASELAVENENKEEYRDDTVQKEAQELDTPSVEQSAELEEPSDREIQFITEVQDKTLNYEEENFQFDIKHAKAETPSEDEAPYNDEAQVLSMDAEAEITEKKPEAKDRWKHKKSQSLSDFFKSVPSSESSIFSSNTQYEGFIDPSPSSSYMEFDESSSYFESRESNSEAKADVHYLSDMFRDADEEQYTQMRLCIVQSKDTVESIAERYEIPILQLLKQNQLDGDDISEGQLLYIPKYKK